MDAGSGGRHLTGFPATTFPKNAMPDSRQIKMKIAPQRVRDPKACPTRVYLGEC